MTLDELKKEEQIGLLRIENAKLIIQRDELILNNIRNEIARLETQVNQAQQEGEENGE